MDTQNPTARRVLPNKEAGMEYEIQMYPIDLQLLHYIGEVLLRCYHYQFLFTKT